MSCSNSSCHSGQEISVQYLKSVKYICTFPGGQCTAYTIQVQQVVYPLNSLNPVLVSLVFHSFWVLTTSKNTIKNNSFSKNLLVFGCLVFLCCPAQPGIKKGRCKKYLSRFIETNPLVISLLDWPSQRARTNLEAPHQSKVDVAKILAQLN